MNTRRHWDSIRGSTSESSGGTRTWAKGTLEDHNLCRRGSCPSSSTCRRSCRCCHLRSSSPHSRPCTRRHRTCLLSLCMSASSRHLGHEDRKWENRREPNRPGVSEMRPLARAVSVSTEEVRDDDKKVCLWKQRGHRTGRSCSPRSKWRNCRNPVPHHTLGRRTVKRVGLR